jgi:hypothetical protein
MAHLVFTGLLEIAQGIDELFENIWQEQSRSKTGFQSGENNRCKALEL